MLDVGLGMQLEEFELVLAQTEEPPPAAALHAEPAAAPELALAVAFVPSFAWLIGAFHRRAVVHVLTAAATGN